MTRVLIHGAGRMARQVLASVSEFENFSFAGLVSRTQPADFFVSDWRASLEQVDKSVDLLIDFTLPGGTASAAQWCEKNHVALISGTTGLESVDLDALKSASRVVPVLWAPNLSQGVALMELLVRQCAAVLAEQAQISIHDVHHQHKLDAPSGTALALAMAAKEGHSGGHFDLNDQPVSFSSVLEGEVIGEHTISFVMADELIEITHKALDRAVFARGALKAGAWLIKQSAGYYSTRDWLAPGD